MTTLIPTGRPIARTVREAMTRNVHHARMTDTISQAARYMAELEQDRLVIVDDRNHVAGLVTQRQMLQIYSAYLDETDFDIASAREAAAGMTIELLVTEDRPPTIRHDAPLAEAMLLMKSHGVDCLPVVDRYQELKGMLSIREILAELTGNEQAGMETGFEFQGKSSGKVKPRPAFVRKANKEIVIPREQVSNEHDMVEKVVLGFDSASGRILVKFIPAGVRLDGSYRLRRTEENVVIAAEAFVDHYRLLERSTIFDTQSAEDTRYLVLVPR